MKQLSFFISYCLKNAKHILDLFQIKENMNRLQLLCPNCLETPVHVLCLISVDYLALIENRAQSLIPQLCQICAVAS